MSVNDIKITVFLYSYIFKVSVKEQIDKILPCTSFYGPFAFKFFEVPIDHGEKEFTTTILRPTIH